MAAMDIAMLGPAKPAIQESFGVDERLGSWILNAFVLSNLMGVPVMSKMADTFGRRKVFFSVVILFAVGGLVVGSAQNYSWLLTGRCIQGLAASGIFPIAAAVTADTYAPEMRGRALGILGAVFGLAFIIGPVIAGLLLNVGWRWIYVGYLPIALLVIAVGAKTIPTSARVREHPIDILGVLSLTGLILALTYGLSRLDPASFSESISQPRIYISFLLFALLIPAFVWFERSAPDPVIRLSMFANKQIAIACLMAIGAGMVEAAFISFPTLASLSMGVSRSAAAYMLIPLSIAIAVGSPLWGQLLDRVGSRVIVLASNLLLLVGLLTIASFPASKALFYVATSLIGLGMAGIMGSALNYILLHESAESERTSSQGVVTLSISIGQLLGAASVGAVVASLGGDVNGYSTAFYGIAIVVAALSVLAFKLNGKEVEQATLK